MQLKFVYDKEKDIWCLLNKGKKSNNSNIPTKAYSVLISKCGKYPDKKAISLFIDEYLAENNYDVRELLQSYQNKFDAISGAFINIVENIFKISLNSEIFVYLTINSRCPYNIENNYFFTPISETVSIIIPMHEIWHFYTWFKFGIHEAEQLGKKKYNDLKEALTVLINIECRHLLPKDVTDIGYPQHREIRSKILDYWKQNPDIDALWKQLIHQSDL
jgi:hypothetical protein